ncbi:MAG TPA: hypothetical protein ENK57_22865 [Polyangiaceae bacterium]|nr:hypothetical protein [Polyangiaceae bacterium]
MTTDASARKPWRPRPRLRPPQVSMQLVDGQGRALRTFNHHGSTFVLGDMGRRYAIELTNHGAQRVEVVVSVDGRDVVHGRQSAGASDRGYVVPAFSSTVIRGFRTSMEEVAAFRFTTPGDSFAGRHGRAMNVGTIRAMVFHERGQQMVRPRPVTKSKRAGAAQGGASAPPPAPRASKGHAARASRDRGMSRRPRANNLGTQFGERTMSRVQEVTFARAQPMRANQTLMLRYDDAAGLRARGIKLFTEPPPRPLTGVGGGWRGRDARTRFAQPPPRAAVSSSW